MANRRSFIAGLLATGLAPRPTWAEVGSPAFLSAGRKPDGSYVLCGLSAMGAVTFELLLPGRGHAAAAHPGRAEAVMFARRPGTFAIVVDCATGRERARLIAAPGRHFYGHGTFSADGDLLFTTENDIDTARGVVGIWNARNDYARVGEFLSGGIGPHDIKLMPDSETLVVANGGIETHPETGRTKRNVPTMRSNLSYLDFDGCILAQVTLGDAHQRNSIRHLAVSGDGVVAFAMQWQGDVTEDLPLLGVHHRHAVALDLMAASSSGKMHGYLGSVAMSLDGSRIVITSPRSGLLQVFEHASLTEETRLVDISGVAATDAGYVATTGTGLVITSAGKRMVHPIEWDNHLVSR